MPVVGDELRRRDALHRSQARAQASPYRFLLPPKTGGVAFVLDAMGEGLHAILDVTLVYPEGRPSLRRLLADRIGSVRVEVRERAIPVEFAAGAYQSDAAFRKRFRAWMNTVWAEKDATIARLSEVAGSRSGRVSPGKVYARLFRRLPVALHHCRTTRNPMKTPHGLQALIDEASSMRSFDR